MPDDAVQTDPGQQEPSHAGYPGAPAEPITGETAFRLDRWQRAGASEEEVAALRDHHSTMAPNQRAFEASAIDATSDNEMAQVLETMRNGSGFTALTQTERPGDVKARQAAEAEEEVAHADPGAQGEGETPEQAAEREAAEAQAAAEAAAAEKAAAEAKAAAGGPGAAPGS